MLGVHTIRYIYHVGLYMYIYSLFQARNIEQAGAIGGIVIGK